MGQMIDPVVSGYERLFNTTALDTARRQITHKEKMKRREYVEVERN